MHDWMTSPYLTLVRKVCGYIPLICFIASIVLLLIAPAYAIAGVALSGYFLFRDTLNTVQGVGPVYWITRDHEVSQRLRVSIGFMREIDFPWRIGKGVHIALFKKSFQIGLCRKANYRDEQEAQLGIIGARFMETEPTEIGNW